MRNGPLVHAGYSRAWYDKLNADLNPLWHGVVIVKHPNDLFAYQEIVSATRPELIVETGTFAGGSALYFAHLLDLQGEGQVVSIDVRTNVALPDHPRVIYMEGVSSVAPDTIAAVRTHAAGKRTMVVLDSAHNKNHVLAELEMYAPLVTKGCYLIVEDSNVDGYFLGAGDIDGEGPAEAIKEFQPSNRGFEQDRTPERFGFSQNPGGFLRRVR